MLVAFKLWLVASDEVVARLSPYDQQRYAEMARELAAGRWLGAYDRFTLVREATYPLWLVAVRATGVPLRIASEALLAIAALAVALALRRRGLSGPTALAVFACAWLAPHSLLVNREILAESLYLPMLLLGVSGLWCAVDARSMPLRVLVAGAAGLALGVAWTTRPEKPVLVLALLGFAALEIAALRAGGLPMRRALARIAGIAAIAALGIAGVGAANAARNGRAYGLRVASDLAGPGLSRGAARAQRTAAPEPQALRPRPARGAPHRLRGKPVARGAGAGHRASGLAPIGELQLARNLRRPGGKLVPVGAARGRDADAAPARCSASRRVFPTHRRRASARARGGVPPRRATLPLLHPYPSTYLAYVGDALARVVARIADAGGPGDWSPSRDDPATPPKIRQLFDDVAGRRTQLTSNGECRARGADRSLRRSRGGDPAAPRSGAPRPGRARVARRGDGAESSFRFRFEKQRPVFLESRPLLELRRASGAMLRIPVSPPAVRPPPRLRTCASTGSRRRASPMLRARRSGAGSGSATHSGCACRRGGRRGAPDPGGASLAGAPRRALLAAAGCSRYASRASRCSRSSPRSTWRGYSVRYVYPAVSPFTIGVILLLCWRCDACAAKRS